MFLEGIGIVHCRIAAKSKKKTLNLKFLNGHFYEAVCELETFLITGTQLANQKSNNIFEILFLHNDHSFSLKNPMLNTF